MEIHLKIILLLVLCFVEHLSIRVKRVIGGEPVESSDMNFMAALIGEKGYSWDVLNVWGEHQKIYCSGSLISNQWIITAAHCFTKDVEEEGNYQNEKNQSLDDDQDFEEDYKRLKGIYNERLQSKKQGKSVSVTEFIDFNVPRYWKVRLAVRNLKPTMKETFYNFLNRVLKQSNRNTYYEVSKIIRHPMYTPFYLENDVALMKLKYKLNLFDINSPQIIPLTSFNNSNSLWPQPGQMCKVIGWGCKEYKGSIMNKPHYVKLPIINPEFCRKIYRTDINLTDHQEFCAGYYGQDKGICSGDSGGPLLCLENGNSVLSGIVSATHKYIPSKFPGIFARISYFKDWILNVMANN